MTEKEKIFNQFIEELEKSKEQINIALNKEFTDSELIEFLTISYDISLIDFTEIFIEQPNSNELTSRLLKVIESDLGSINSPSILNKNICESIIKADIKAKGIKWRIIIADPDPFPSSPHAHSCDENIKLHLGNGLLYRKKKRLDSHISKKDLIFIREQISKKIKGVILPILDI